MRKFLIWTGLITAIVGVAIAAVYFYLSINSADLDTPSKDAALRAFIAITSHWDQQALLKDASPEYLKTLNTDKKIEKLFTLPAKLGALSRPEGCTGGAFIVLTLIKGEQIMASYDCSADYANGKATVKVQLIKIHESWLINGFHLVSPAPAQPES